MKFCVVVSCLFFSSVYCTPPRVRSRLEIARDEYAQRYYRFKEVLNAYPDNYVEVEFARTHLNAMGSVIVKQQAAKKIITFWRMYAQKKNVSSVESSSNKIDTIEFDGYSSDCSQDTQELLRSSSSVSICSDLVEELTAVIDEQQKVIDDLIATLNALVAAQPAACAH